MMRCRSAHPPLCWVLGSVPRVFEKVSDRWEVCIAASDDGFQQISFANSIATTKGGTHVAHVADQVGERW